MNQVRKITEREELIELAKAVMADEAAHPQRMCERVVAKARAILDKYDPQPLPHMGINPQWSEPVGVRSESLNTWTLSIALARGATRADVTHAWNAAVKAIEAVTAQDGGKG